MLLLLLLLLEELESDSKSEEEEELLEEGEEEEEELLSSLSLSEEEEEVEESSLSEEESLAELSLLLLLELVTLLDLRENKELSTALPEPITHTLFPLLCRNNPEQLFALNISVPHHRNFQASPSKMNSCALPSLLHSWVSGFWPCEQWQSGPRAGHNPAGLQREAGRGSWPGSWG